MASTSVGRLTTISSPPTLLERCVEVLDRDPRVVLCHSQVAHIDQDGELIETISRHRPTEIPTWRLFGDLIESDDACEETYGVVRRAALAATGLEQNYTDSDRVMLAHLGLLGRFHEVPEVLFSKRFHPEMSTELYPDWRDRMRQYGEQYGDAITLPTWLQFGHYLRIVVRTPVGVVNRLMCLALMVRWVFTYRKWRSLLKDLVLAAQALPRAIRSSAGSDEAVVVAADLPTSAPQVSTTSSTTVDDLAMTNWSARPRVGVVVPNYNKAAFVEETLRSVLSQTYPAVELVVVDDGSSDDSVARIEAVLSGTDGRLIQLDNGGVSRARNTGFAALDDDVEYVMFLDADDLLEPHALDALVSYIEAHPPASVAYAISTLIDEHGAPLGREPYQHRWEPFGPGRRRIGENEPRTSLASVYARFQLLPSGSLIRRSSFERTSGWDSSLCRPMRPFHAEDKDMATQLALVGEVHRVAEPLYRYRILPTPHRSTMYEGLKELDRKWWHASLPRSTRRAVRRAIRFNARVSMLDVGRAWFAAMVGGGGGPGGMSRAEATKNLASSVARWLTLPVRLMRAGPPEAALTSS